MTPTGKEKAAKEPFVSHVRTGAFSDRQLDAYDDKELLEAIGALYQRMRDVKGTKGVFVAAIHVGAADLHSLGVRCNIVQQSMMRLLEEKNSAVVSGNRSHTEAAKLGDIVDYLLGLLDPKDISADLLIRLRDVPNNFQRVDALESRIKEARAAEVRP